MDMDMDMDMEILSLGHLLLLCFHTSNWEVWVCAVKSLISAKLKTKNIIYITNYTQ